jgi:hypothetical protein
MAVSARSLLDPRVTLTAAQERDFFQSIRLPNGVFKTTTDRRLDDVNALLIDALGAADAAPREVLDVAVSSGISSVELIEAMAAAGFEAALTATDLSLSGTLVALSRNHYVLIDRSGEILQHTIAGVPLRPWPRRIDALTGYWLVRRTANAVARAALARRSGGEKVMLVSGRASFEIMQKALAARVPIVAAVSAPSSLAVEFAEDSGMTLVGFLREGRMNVYAEPKRVRFT